MTRPAPTEASKAWKSGGMWPKPRTVTVATVTTRVELPTVMPAPRPVAAKVRPVPAARPAGADTEWRDSALCAQADPDAWFPDKGTPGKAARKICVGCPVRQECIDDALATGDRWGIRGGLSERERSRLRAGAVA